MSLKFPLPRPESDPDVPGDADPEQGLELVNDLELHVADSSYCILRRLKEAGVRTRNPAAAQAVKRSQGAVFSEIRKLLHGTACRSSRLRSAVTALVVSERRLRCLLDLIIVQEKSQGQDGRFTCSILDEGRSPWRATRDEVVEDIHCFLDAAHPEEPPCASS